MAHKGKVFKKWIRRDLALSDDWRVGQYPEAFIANVDMFTSTLFPMEKLNDQLLYNLRADSSTTREWTADTPAGPGFRLRGRLIIESEDWGNELQFRYQVLVEFDFRILDVIMTTERPSQRYSRWRARRVDEVIIKDTRIDILPPFSGECDFVYAPYARYNP